MGDTDERFKATTKETTKIFSNVLAGKINQPHAHQQYMDDVNKK